MKAKWMKSGGIAAIVVGLTLAAVPASAQDGGWRGRGDGGRSAQAQGAGGGEWRGRGQEHGQSADRPARVERAQPQQTQVQRDWSGRRGGNDGDRGGNRWGNRSDGNAGNSWRGRVEQPSAAPAAPALRQAEPQRKDRWERNRNNTDPQRNRAYRADGRDGSWWNNGRNDNGRDAARNSWRGDNNTWRGNNGNRWSNNNQRWNRDWRRDNRYDWSGYRNTNRNVFRLGTYYSPYRNYSYRRVGIGFGLDSLFFGSRYLINDPWQYRLPEAYGPYRWVRYFDDALLVDVYSGQVVDAIYDFFW